MAAARAEPQGRRVEASGEYRDVLVAGVAIWAVTFVAALAIFPLRADERPLFESIMPVVLTAATVVAAGRHFAPVRPHKGLLANGAVVGTVWLAISLALDALMFSRGPMQMALADYLKDIGVTYIIILVVPLGFSALATAYRRS
jgi:hypothetical protein